ncbi:hypothetical protein JCM33374_g2652 [Metschnikowia sp. JCM 33374]|nr:hypothetical protein JCM33374_g2652 [Metschnikowia sp. JCM 33374]
MYLDHLDQRFPYRRVTRKARIAHSKEQSRLGKKTVLISRGRNDISIRKPVPTSDVLVFNTLTRKIDQVYGIVSSADNYVGEIKNSLHNQPDDHVKVAADNSLLTDVTRSVVVAAEQFVNGRPSLQERIPESFKQASESPNRKRWLKACDEEMDAHKYNGTFTLVPLEEGMKPIGCRWVFTKKDGDVFKARLVAKVFTQVPGVDYGETFSPVIKHTSLRLLFAIASKEKMQMHQMDVKTAFLNGVLKEELYMRQPPGYSSSKIKGEFVYKLNKSLYGLKQAPQVWNETINRELKTQGFKSCNNEPCLFVKGSGSGYILLALYVDDLLIVSSSDEEIAIAKKKLSEAFKMKDLGLAKKFLGMNIEFHPTFTKIHLGDYVNSLLIDYGHERTRIISTPAAQINLDELQEGKEDFCDDSEYRSIVGKLLYAANTVRFDIACIVSQLSRHLINPSFASIKNSKAKSRTGSSILYGGAPISWKSKLQTMVAISTVNAELIALSYTVAESIWLINLLKELGLTHKCQMYCDNQGTIKTVRNPALLDGTKHVLTKTHFVKQYSEEGWFKLDYINTKENVADILTKVLARPEFTYLRSKGKIRERP